MEKLREFNGDFPENIPGQTIVIKTIPSAEQGDIESSLQSIARVKQIKEQYSDFQREELENEYMRLYSDFELHMRHQEDEQAILGLLVEQFGMTSEDLVKLRK